MLRFTVLAKLLVLVMLLPWLALLVLGLLWLWQHGWLYQGLGVLAANLALLLSLLRWRRRRAAPLVAGSIRVDPDPNWPDRAQAAWAELAEVAEHWRRQPAVFSDPSRLLRLSNEVLIRVARHFHAESSYPVLEFPLPYLLKLTSLICRDLQHDVLDKIPGSHAVRVGDFLRAKRLLDSWQRLKSAYDVGYWLVNWSGAALAKARSILVKTGMRNITDEIGVRLVEAYINKLGYYAIQLYSGRITLEDIAPAEQLTPQSKADLNRPPNGAGEPLRILVLGQISSGKSSLINALFKDVKSAEGVVPTTPGITPYLLEHDRLPQMIILDSAGYGGLLHRHAEAELVEASADVDMILMVCSAVHAARRADAERLRQLRRFYLEQRPLQAMPAVIAVVTHIDRLRPLHEWAPPYDICRPGSAKAEHIRQACEAIAADLAMPLGGIVPVCLAADKPAYNIEDGLMPLIYQHLNEADKARYLRCLRLHHRESYWRQWRKQAQNAGKLLLEWSGKITG